VTDEPSTTEADAGGFLVAAMEHISRVSGWHVVWYEPAAALLGGLGVWAFSARRDRRTGWIAVAAALAAMLLGELYRGMSAVAFADWISVPGYIMEDAFRLRLFGRGAPDFDWHVWPKLLRYAFGMFIGWYLGTSHDAEVASE
jgi:hypothetical protein